MSSKEMDMASYNGSIGVILLNGGMEMERKTEAYRENPFLNEIVVEKLLQCIESQYLFKSRLVCKLWNTKAWNQIRRRCVIKIERHVLNQADTIFSLRLTKLEFTNFDVKDFSGQLKSFFNLGGIHVKELVLAFQDTQFNVQQLFIIFLLYTLNLESLTLKYLPCDLFHSVGIERGEEDVQTSPLLKLKNLTIGERCHYDEGADGASFFVKLFSFMPNLETLKGKLFWSVTDMIKALNIAKLPKLMHLSLLGALTRESAESLEHLNLRTLYLGVATHYNDNTDHNVIYAQRSTIETLGVGWASFQSRVSQDQLVSDFPHLKYLSLCDSSKWDFQPCPAKYLTPTSIGIRKLRVDIRRVPDLDFIMRNPCFENVEHLDICFCVPLKAYAQQYLISTIKLTFPHLSVLTLRACSYFPFGLIFKYFTDLEKLAVHITGPFAGSQRSLYLDDIFVGLEDSRCQTMRENYNSKNQVEGDIEESMKTAEAMLLHAREQGFDRMPLSNLQKLKKLIIVTRQYVISSVTVQMCLSIMPKLASITIDTATPSVESDLKSMCSPAVYIHVITVPTRPFDCTPASTHFEFPEHCTKYELD